MPHPNRKPLHHDPPHWLPNNIGYLYFITINTKPRGTNQLCNPTTSQAVLSAAQHYNDTQIWHCSTLLLMPDHLHALISILPAESIAKKIGNFKSYLAKTQKIPWQKDFFDHRLRHDESTAEKAEYIRQNPIKAGLITKDQIWPYFWQTTADSPLQ